MKVTRRTWITAATGVAVAIVAVRALMPEPLEVEVTRLSRAPLEVSVVEDGITRVRERYEVTAPVAGRLLRIEVHAGDAVDADAALLRIAPAPLDPKQEAQLTARLRAAEEAEREARAVVQRATEAARRAEQEAKRIRKLASDSIASADALEAALTAAAVAGRDRDAARYRAEASAYDVVAARAALGSSGDGSEVIVRAPVHGKVLQVLHESETVVTPGMPLVVIGQPESIEIVADFLSTDAVSIREGDEARIEQWGGTGALAARVRRVEPSAFTKVSALGIEEQRVNVICDLSTPQPSLGDQYRVDVRVILWDGEANTIPSTALFTERGKWNVFVVREGRVRKQAVEIGHQGSDSVEIVSGLGNDDEVVTRPSDQVSEGTRVAIARR